jgi:hypothetical protein
MIVATVLVNEIFHSTRGNAARRRPCALVWLTR